MLLSLLMHIPILHLSFHSQGPSKVARSATLRRQIQYIIVKQRATDVAMQCYCGGSTAKYAVHNSSKIYCLWSLFHLVS